MRWRRTRHCRHLGTAQLNTMKKITLLLALFFSSILGISAQIALRGKITNIPANAIQVALVDYWAVDHWQQLAILQLQADGAFSANITPPVQAQCRIRMAGQNKAWTDFMLPPTGIQPDSTLLLDLDFTAMNGSPARIKGSAENEVYFELMTAYHSLNLLRDSSAATPPTTLREAEHQFNLVCQKISQEHRESFTGDMVANLLRLPEPIPTTEKTTKETLPSSNAFAIAHALENIPFRSEKILYHNGFAKALNRYYLYFEPKNEENSKLYVDGIMSRRNGSEAVDVFLFKYLLDKMLDAKDEAGLHHLLTWYLPDCSDESPLPNYIKTLIQALKSCEPGKTIPDQRMPGPDGNSISMESVCAKNKITLLFFWRSNCSHCKEFKPVLAALYDKYHPLGLEILAFSLDNLEVGWKESLQREPTKWVNAFIPAEQRKAINLLFPIPSTPTLIALDNTCTVVSRLILREQLEVFLKEKLGEK